MSYSSCVLCCRWTVFKTPSLTIRQILPLGHALNDHVLVYSLDMLGCDDEKMTFKGLWKPPAQSAFVLLLSMIAQDLDDPWSIPVGRTNDWSLRVLGLEVSQQCKYSSTKRIATSSSETKSNAVADRTNVFLFPPHTWFSIYILETPMDGLTGGNSSLKVEHRDMLKLCRAASS